MKCLGGKGINCSLYVWYVVSILFQSIVDFNVFFYLFFVDLNGFYNQKEKLSFCHIQTLAQKPSTNILSINIHTDPHRQRSALNENAWIMILSKKRNFLLISLRVHVFIVTVSCFFSFLLFIHVDLHHVCCDSRPFNLSLLIFIAPNSMCFFPSRQRMWNVNTE